MKHTVLEVNDLVTRFYTEEGVVRAVDGISFKLVEGQTLGIVGESGSGKTVTALSIMGLIENPGSVDNGSIQYRGEEVLEMGQRRMRRIRGKHIAMVFQDSLSSLNPTLSIEEQVRRVLKFHSCLSKKETTRRIIELVNQVGISNPKERVTNYPHELSGGMRQRILIAMAISCNPSILLLDEPTTALDVTIEAQIFELVDKLKRELAMGSILITHDLGVVANTCDTVIVMYAGRIVERADVELFYRKPLHPYSNGLLKSIPGIHDNAEKRLYSIPGEVPDLITLPQGCNYSPRCEIADKRCLEMDPELREIAPGREVACLKLNAFEDKDFNDQ